MATSAVNIAISPNFGKNFSRVNFWSMKYTIWKLIGALAEDKIAGRDEAVCEI